MFINTVVIAGNLTRDPDLRSTPGGTMVCDISVAVNEFWTDKDGNRHEKAHFFDVTVWGKQAEAVARHLGKGDLVAIEGALRQDRWEAEDGSKRSRVMITADRVQFGPKRQGNPGSNEAADAEAAKREAVKEQFRRDEGDKPPF